jgi:hypothetical protein
MGDEMTDKQIKNRVKYLLAKDRKMRKRVEGLSWDRPEDRDAINKHLEAGELIDSELSALRYISREEKAELQILAE